REEARRSRDARGAARLLRGQGGEVVDSRRRRIRRGPAAHRHRQAPQDATARALPRPSVAGGRGRARGGAVLAFQAARHERTALVAVQLLLARLLVARLHLRLLRGLAGRALMVLLRGAVVSAQALLHELLMLFAVQALRLVRALGEAFVLRLRLR